MPASAYWYAYCYSYWYAYWYAYRYALLVRFTGTLYWYALLVRFTGTLYWYALLVRLLACKRKRDTRLIASAKRSCKKALAVAAVAPSYFNKQESASRLRILRIPRLRRNYALYFFYKAFCFPKKALP